MNRRRLPCGPMWLCLSFFWMAGAAPAQVIHRPAHEGTAPRTTTQTVGAGAVHEVGAPSRSRTLAPAGRPTARCAGCETAPALLARAAADAGVDPHLVRAVAWAESAFRPDAFSAKGAMGLMQLMPATARQYGVSDPFDPWQSAQGGSRLLRDLLDRYAGDTRLALAAYNAGPRAVERAGRAIPNYPETQAYVSKVLARQSRLLALSGPGAASASWSSTAPTWAPSAAARGAGAVAPAAELWRLATDAQPGRARPPLSSRRIGNALLLTPAPAPRNLPGPLDT